MFGCGIFTSRVTSHLSTSGFARWICPQHGRVIFYGFYHGVRHREKTRTNNKEIQAASFKDLFFGMFTSFGEDSNRFWLCFIRLNTLTTLPEPNSSHLKVDGLEDSNCFWGPANFQVRAVSFREGRSTVWIANHGSQSQSRRFQNIIRFWIMDIGLLGSSCNWRWAPQTYIFRGFFNGKQPDFSVAKICIFPWFWGLMVYMFIKTQSLEVQWWT